MNKIISTFMLVFAVVLLNSCVINFDGGVVGNGNVIIEERPVQEFFELKAERGLHVFVQQGDEHKLVVEADENLHELIVTRVTGGRLEITSRENIREADEKNIYVTVVNIESIHASSAASVESQTIISSPTLDLSSSSAANIKLDVDARQIVVNASSAGVLKINGKCIDLDAEASSAGIIKAKNLHAQNCKASASSAGNISVYVEETISLNASSGGGISYGGNARITSTNVSSGGRINQRN